MDPATSVDDDAHCINGSVHDWRLRGNDCRGIQVQEMRTTLRFIFVVALALMGAIVHKIKPKRREIREDWFV